MAPRKKFHPKWKPSEKYRDFVSKYANPNTRPAVTSNRNGDQENVLS
jgi:hypothetical protein